jgi:hypothetical protein
MVSFGGNVHDRVPRQLTLWDECNPSVKLIRER